MNKNEEKNPGTEPQENLLRVRLRACYPDENPGDDAEWEQLGVRYIDESSHAIGRYKQIEGELSGLCRAYPEFGQLVTDMIRNKLPLRAAIARLFSQDELIPQQDDEDFDAYRTAYRSRMDAVSRREEQGREIDTNEAASIAAIDDFCSEKGLDDEQKEALIDLINDHFTELLYKRITPEMLEGFLKQMHFDDAVADADHTGELRGRNANIEARRAAEQEATSGDGLPGTNGGGSIGNNTRSIREFFNQGATRTNYSQLLNKKKQ